MTSDNPYMIFGPALISFSGGRTSGMMLWKILDAHGGELPDDVLIAFANTGKEREETLRFVHDCSTHWGIHINWLEWRRRERGDPWEDGYTRVGLNSASRNGEPFTALIQQKKYLPNPVTRFCTIELKIRVMRNFAKAHGWKNWKNIVGLRRDEMSRVFKGIERNENGSDPWTSVFPMASAPPHGLTEKDVMEFWSGQPFDLQLKQYEGNCDACFLKGRATKMRLERDNPGILDWWVEAEKTCPATNQSGAQFRSEESVEDIQKAAINSPLLPGIDEEFEGCDFLCA